jgi:hypothetical protein
MIAMPRDATQYFKHMGGLAGTSTPEAPLHVSDPLTPGFVAQIPLGELVLPSGTLRNKKSINLVYVQPGARSQTA